MRYSIEDMRAIARERGGDCLSDAYGGTLVKLEWRCDRGHIWAATPNTILGGCWCPKCRLRLRDIDEMRDRARARRTLPFTGVREHGHEAALALRRGSRVGGDTRPRHPQPVMVSRVRREDRHDR
jgi:hypothetical protein